MNAAQLATLRAELAEDPAGLGYGALGQDYEAVAAALNTRPQVPNPEKQGVVPRGLSLLEVFAAVRPGEALAIYERPALLADVKAAIEGDDRSAMAALLGLVAASGLVSAGSLAAVQALLATTMPDPSWTVTVPGSSRAALLGLPAVLAADVQLVLNSGGN